MYNDGRGNPMLENKYFISYEKNSFHLLRNDKTICSASLAVTGAWQNEDLDTVTEIELIIDPAPFRGYDIPAFKEFLDEINFILYSEFEQYVGHDMSQYKEHIEKSTVRKMEITDKLKAVVVPPTA